MMLPKRWECGVPRADRDTKVDGGHEIDGPLECSLYGRSPVLSGHTAITSLPRACCSTKFAQRLRRLLERVHLLDLRANRARIDELGERIEARSAWRRGKHTHLLGNKRRQYQRPDDAPHRAEDAATPAGRQHQRSRAGERAPNSARRTARTGWLPTTSKIRLYLSSALVKSVAV